MNATQDGRLFGRFHCFATTQNTFEYSTWEADDTMSFSNPDHKDVTAASGWPDSMEPRLPGYESLSKSVYR
jgi:hypothetical protein